jgi:23S rRNA (pseudouridine1915-N3)-methyltransferase
MCGNCYTKGMQITIIMVGKASDAATAHFVESYEKRLRQWADLQWVLVVTGKNADDESGRIIKQLKPTDFVVLLDERGTQATTSKMAESLDVWLASGRKLVFVIGGAYGVSHELQARADFVWSFSQLVFPHQLMRVLLSEQLYRMFNLRAGGKYHHE